MFPEIRHALQQHEVVRYLETENIRWPQWEIISPRRYYLDIRHIRLSYGVK